MSRQTTLIVVMWVGAATAATVLWMTRTDERAVEPAGPAPGEPVHVTDAPDVQPPPSPALSDSPMRMLRGDARHTGRSAQIGPDEAELAWLFETEARISAQIVSDAEGNLYAASHDHHLYALDPYGRERWKADLLDRIYSTPAIDESGNVYVGSDADVFWSFRPDGRLRWRLDTEGDADTGVAFAGDYVVFGADRHLYAVRRNGNVAWRFETGGKIYSTPAVDDEGNIYFGCQDDSFYSLDPEGELRWSYRTGGDNDASPGIADDGTIVFGSDDHNVYAMNPNGTLRWSTDLDGMVRAPVGFTLDGGILVGVYGPRPRLVRLDLEGGQLRWFFPVTVVDTTEIGVSSGPLVDRAGNIYFGAHDDYLYSLAPSGELRWAFATGGDVDSSPILTPSGVLVTASDDHRVYAFEPL